MANAYLFIYFYFEPRYNKYRYSTAPGRLPDSPSFTDVESDLAPSADPSQIYISITVVMDNLMIIY